MQFFKLKELYVLEVNSKYDKAASNYSLKIDGGVLLRYFVILRLVALRFFLPCCLRSVTTFLNFRYLP